MQVVRFFLLFLSPLLLFMACQNVESEKNDNIFLLVGIASEGEDTLASLTLRDTTFTSKITNDSFRFEISIEGKQTGSLNVNDEYQNIFAQGGHDIVIDFSNDTTTFSGSLAPLYNQYEEMVAKHLKNSLPEDYKEMYALEIDTFQEIVYTGSRKIEEDLDTSLENSFEDWGYLMWAELTGNWAYYSLLHPVLYPRYSGDTSFSVTKDYYIATIDSFNIADVTLLQSPSRESLIKAAVENWVRVDTSYIESDSARLLFMFDVAESMFEQDTISNIAKYHIVLDQMKYQGFGNAQDLIGDFVASIKNPSKKRELSQLISKWEKLEKGNAAPTFTAQKPDSTQISLDELRGNVVYLDVWATWCGPCLREVPHLEEMQEHYSGKENLKIVSVSIDSDYQKWYDMVQEKEMEGLQLWIENAWESKLNEEYLIKSIPRFILIDKQGNIVDADAPRPSSKEEIYAMIDQELNQ